MSTRGHGKKQKYYEEKNYGNSAEPCITTLWKLWSKNKPRGIRLAWCAGPKRKSKGKGRYLPLQTYVRNSSALYRAYESGRLIESFKIIKFLNTVKRLPMESKGLGHGISFP